MRDINTKVLILLLSQNLGGVLQDCHTEGGETGGGNLGVYGRREKRGWETGFSIWRPGYGT